MKRIILPALLLLCCLICNAQQQTSYEPQLLILSPNSVTFDPTLKKDMDVEDETMKKWAAQILQQATPNDQPDNLKLMLQSIKEFMKQAGVPSQASAFAQTYLTYRFYEKFPNCLILLKDEKSNGSTDDLQKIANVQKAPYVLNFSKVSFYKQNGETHCKMNVQLYEQQSNKLLIDKEYAGDWNNHGFEFTCDQGTIGCTINNSLAQVLPDVISQIASNNTTLRNEKLLAGKRAAFIANSVYPQHFDVSLIQKATAGSNFKIDMKDLYQCFYNEDHTKFVGFFIKTIDKKDAKSMLTDKEDGNVTVITSKDIHDKDYLDQSPKTYAYIVRGIKYNNKWYTDKSEVTYFDAPTLEDGKLQYLNNLQKWDFFQENSAERGSQFWEGKLFEKIEDKRKDPKWEKYKNMWASEERENRDYIGQYELVAIVLKKEKEFADRAFRNQIKTKILLPFYYSQVKSRLNHIIGIPDTAAYFALIYPKDRHVVLNPLKVTDENGVKSIRYFVLLPQTNEIFEWTLVRPYILKKDEYSDDPITKTISAFTPWNFSYATLDDETFWIEKVLAKDGNNYKYLNRLKP